MIDTRHNARPFAGTWTSRTSQRLPGGTLVCPFDLDELAALGAGHVLGDPFDREPAIGLVLRAQLDGVQPAQRFVRIAEQADRVIVGILDAGAFEIVDDDRLGGHREHRAQHASLVRQLMLGGDILVTQHDVANGALPVPERYHRHLDRDAPAFDVDVLELAGVVPERRDHHALSCERAAHRRQHAERPDQLVFEDVVVGRRHRAEQLAERAIDDQAMAVGARDRKRVGRLGEQRLEQEHRIGDGCELFADVIRFNHSTPTAAIHITTDSSTRRPRCVSRAAGQNNPERTSTTSVAVPGVTRCAAHVEPL
jgi:hypothetical protein